MHVQLRRAAVLHFLGDQKKWQLLVKRQNDHAAVRLRHDEFLPVAENPIRRGLRDRLDAATIQHAIAEKSLPGS